MNSQLQHWTKNQECLLFKRPSISSALTRNGTQRSPNEIGSVYRTPTYSLKSPKDSPNQRLQHIMIILVSNRGSKSFTRTCHVTRLLQVWSCLPLPASSSKDCFFHAFGDADYLGHLVAENLVRCSQRQHVRNTGSLLDLDPGVTQLMPTRC
jgi:hypothetical protein